MSAAPPQPHFPSPYRRPSVAPRRALRVKTPDGALIASFAYEPVRPTTAAPLLMLHGNGEEHGIFGPVIDAVLATGRMVVAIDSRAQGKSSRGGAPLSYELMASDALAAMDALGVGRFHVMGFSDGGIEALLLARDEPKRVQSLLAIGANLTPEGVVEEDDWDIAGSAGALWAWADWLDAADGRDMDASLLTPGATEARTTAELLSLMLAEPHIEASSLSAVRCPSTVLVGEHDCIAPWQTKEIVEGLRAGGSDVRLEVLPDCGHGIPKERPEELCRVVLELLSRAERP